MGSWYSESQSELVIFWHMTYEVVFAFMPTRPLKFIVFMVYDALPLSQQLFGKEKKKLLLFIGIVWLFFFSIQSLKFPMHQMAVGTLTKRVSVASQRALISYIRDKENSRDLQVSYQDKARARQQ